MLRNALYPGTTLCSALLYKDKSSGKPHILSLFYFDLQKGTESLMFV